MGGGGWVVPLARGSHPLTQVCTRDRHTPPLDRSPQRACRQGQKRLKMGSEGGGVRGGSEGVVRGGSEGVVRRACRQGQKRLKRGSEGGGY